MQIAVECGIDVVAEKPDSPVAEECVRPAGVEASGTKEPRPVHLQIGNPAVGGVVAVSRGVGRNGPYPRESPAAPGLPSVPACAGGQNQGQVGILNQIS